MEDKKLNQLLKNSLSTDFEPTYELNAKIVKKSREMMNVRRLKKFPAVAAICCALLCCSVTVFAAWIYLTPKDIATEYGDEKLAIAFESENAIIMKEIQTFGEYTISLLGSISGSDLSGFCSDSNQVSPARTYVAVAIFKTDGTPMPEALKDNYGKDSFFISPFIQGLNPNEYNISTMNGGYFEIVKNGIMYRMIECDNIELFADRSLYLCVCNTDFYDREAYIFNEETGMISVNSSYEGMNLLFDLSLSTDNVDEEAAEQYLEKLALSEKAALKEDTTVINEETEEKVDINKIIEQWTLVSVQKVTPDEDGRIYFSYETKNGSGSGFITEDAEFAEGEVGYSKNVIFDESVNTKVAVIYYRDKNGVVTVSVYEIDK